MNRRDFLKSLGLAGVALTLPKPIEVIAAKMSDIKGPPVQVGFTSLKMEEPFMVSHMSWAAYPMAVREAVVSVHLDNPTHGRIGKVLQLSLPSPYEGVTECTTPIYLPTDTSIELWTACRNANETPPRVCLQVHGYVGRVEDGMMRGFGNIFTLATKHVRLERARAIELGLVDPAEEKLVIT